MKDWNAVSDDAFRAEMREFIEKNYPEKLRFFPLRPRWAVIKPWIMRLVEQGWSAPNWPVEYGGMGLSPNKVVIFLEEQERWGVARGPDQGIFQLGPMLIRYGTEEQRKLLPAMRKYETIWCQGYSEPNAGSDLASLATEAVPDGDDFIINGRKIWTSIAFDATNMYLLARTDKTVKKQAGITFFLLDMMKTSGVTVRGIKNIAGGTEFCETVFDNVRIPRTNIVGELNQGWTVANSLLGYERHNNGSPRRAAYAFSRLEALARERNLYADPGFVERFTKLRLDLADLEAVYAHFAAQVARNEALGPDISITKLLSTETYQRITEFMLETAGDLGIDVWEANSRGKINAVTPFLQARAMTIGAGTNEIHRNILAKRVLKLPS